MLARIAIRTIMCCLLFLISTVAVVSQSTDIQKKWNHPIGVTATFGANFISSQPAPTTPPVRDYGEVLPGFTASLTATKKIPMSKAIDSELGLGIRYSGITNADQSLFLTSPSGNDAYIETATYLRYLEARLPLLIGSHSKNRKFSYAIGGFAAYRFADFSFSDRQIFRHGVNPPVVNPGGGSGPVITATSHSPQVTSERNSDLSLPANEFQFGLLAKAAYNISLFESLNDFMIGLSIQRYLSSNEIWHGHELKWRSELLISTQF